LDLTILFGLGASLAWHFFWSLGIQPVPRTPSFSSIGGRAVYAGSILGDNDLLPFSAGKKKARSLFGIQERKKDVLRPLEKVGDRTPKPEVFVSDTWPLSRAFQEDAGAQRREFSGRPRDVVFGMSDYGRFLYQADFSDLKRAADRQELRDTIVFDVFLAADGRVKKIRKIAGSGDPSLDLFIQSKINNAVFRPDASARECWITVRFQLR